MTWVQPDCWLRTAIRLNPSQPHEFSCLSFLSFGRCWRKLKSSSSHHSCCSLPVTTAGWLSHVALWGDTKGQARQNSHQILKFHRYECRASRYIIKISVVGHSLGFLKNTGIFSNFATVLILFSTWVILHHDPNNTGNTIGIEVSAFLLLRNF